MPYFLSKNLINKLLLKYFFTLIQNKNKKKMLKRYQYRTKDGIKWSEWFKISDNSDKPLYQLDKKLLNEYKDE